MLKIRIKNNNNLWILYYFTLNWFLKVYEQNMHKAAPLLTGININTNLVLSFTTLILITMLT